MIVCTCDTCGRVVEDWYTLNVNLKGESWKLEVCIDCHKSVRNKIDSFIDSITVTDADKTQHEK